MRQGSKPPGAHASGEALADDPSPAARTAARRVLAAGAIASVLTGLLPGPCLGDLARQTSRGELQNGGSYETTRVMRGSAEVLRRKVCQFPDGSRIDSQTVLLDGRPLVSFTTDAESTSIESSGIEGAGWCLTRTKQTGLTFLVVTRAEGTVADVFLIGSRGLVPLPDEDLRCFAGNMDGFNAVVRSLEGVRDTSETGQQEVLQLLGRLRNLVEQQRE